MLSSDKASEIQQTVELELRPFIDLMYSFGALGKKSPTLLAHVPVSFTPKKIQEKEYEGLRDSCQSFNEDLAFIYNKFDDLLGFYKEYSKEDELVDILLKILHLSEQKPKCIDKPIALIVRNDFMYDIEQKTFKQVEFNNFCAGIAQMSNKVGEVVKLFTHNFLKKNDKFVPNKNPQKAIEFFNNLYKMYNNQKAVFLEVNWMNETNHFDCIPNEKLLTRIGVPNRRLCVTKITPSVYHIDEETKQFYVNGEEVAVIYWRSLYDSSMFNEERIQFWATAERSKAILIPDVKFYIIGIKLTQHLLWSEKLLNKYALNDLKGRPFKKHLCETLSIVTDFDNNKQKMLDYANKHKNSLILKTFKEGGMGFVLVEQEMIDFIEKEPLEQIAKTLLAHRIVTPVAESLSLIDEKVTFHPETTSELGIYHSLILKPNGKKFDIVSNEVWSYLLRTKNLTEIKGGVSLGRAFIDSLIYQES